MSYHIYMYNKNVFVSRCKNVDAHLDKIDFCIGHSRLWISRWQAEIYRDETDRWNAISSRNVRFNRRFSVSMSVLETKDPGPLIPRRMFCAREHSFSQDSAVSYGACEHVGARVDTRSRLSWVNSPGRSVALRSTTPQDLSRRLS